MALIAACDAFVTNDSGLMHVAAAVDTPQVGIIGSTDPVATGPANPRSVLARVADACYLAPCMKPVCPIDHRCMTAVTVDMVAEMVQHVLATTDGAGP